MTLAEKLVFSPALYEFLVDLSLNNRRDWFEENKPRYERDVREPALAFVRAMGERLPALSAHLVASDKKSGGSLMRIYRDTRFSKDKTPYKTNVGIQFRHAAGKDVHAPGFYVHITPDECFLGGGMWHPASPELKQIREAIVADPDAFLAAVEAPEFVAHYALHGESLKRAPKGFDVNHPQIEHLRRKDFIGLCPMTPEDILADDVVERVFERFAGSAQLMSFLCTAIGQPW